MQRQPGDFFRDSSRSLTATVIMGLLATASAPPAIAHEVKDQKETGVCAVGSHAAVTPPSLATAMNHRILDDAPLDAAIRTLFCLEAREAVNRGQLDREGQQWILANGHRCPDERLLFDALGF